MASELPAAFSKEADGAEREPHGMGQWWGALIRRNAGGADSVSKPYAFVLGCGQTGGTGTPNAYKVAGHIVGDINEVKFCTKATADNKRLANSKRAKQPTHGVLTPHSGEGSSVFEIGV